MPGVVDTSHTFATNEVITSTLMNNIIDQTLFTSDALSGGTLALVAGKMKVATSGVTSNELAANAVTANAIAADAVVTAKIADNSVTTAKIADAQVTTAKILDANVTTAKIADANITAPKLNGAQTGTAPIYGVRAWVNFDGTTADNIGGTYARDATTVTVTTSVNHGLIVGHKVYLDFTSGAAVDGAFVVTGITSNTIFTVTHGTSGTTSGNVTLNRRLIRGSGNVANISLLGVGQYAVNFAIAFPNANYARSGFSNFTTAAVGGLVGGNNATGTTAESCDIFVANSGTGAELNTTVVNVIFVG
jgi:hypothetical protein